MIPAHILQAAYDRGAATYDAQFYAQQAPKIRALARACPAPPAGPVVDLGAGTGLVARLTNTPVLAVDLSSGMLALGPKPAVVADLRALPFSNDRFAMAWCVTAIIDVHDAPQMLGEIARVLKPGGLLALSVLVHQGVAPVVSGLRAHGFELLSTVDIPPDFGWIARLSTHEGIQ